MEKKSVWSAEVKLPKFEQLRGRKKTDVLVIGGGICGILCAHFLKRAGIDCILAEGSRIASGITKNTTAKITFQHGLIYDRLIREFGAERAKMHLEANRNALIEYSRLCENIDCDFETLPAYTYSVSDRAKIERDVKAAVSLGVPAEFTDDIEPPVKIAGAVRFPDQAQFNPLKFISKTAENLNIFENTFIRDITPTTAVSDTGEITAEKIIVATHFPFINKHGGYFIKLYQHRSYVSAYEGAGTLSGMYVDESEKGMSFRSFGELLLIGGGGHRTGKKGGGRRELREFAEKHYRGARLRYEWAAQDCMSLDGVPYIGQYSKNTPNLYTASGFNKWGMTSSMAAAKILCDMVLGRKNEYAEVFSPSRNPLKPQVFVNGMESATNLLTPSLKRCPHMGCALKWNEEEQSWDCPCHGSRFGKDGALIDNPATGGLRD